MAKKIADISLDRQSMRASLRAARQAAEQIYQHFVQIFSYVGEACIVEARTNGAYRDITGNLRSSIGYIVLVDGKAVVNSRQSVVKAGQEGASQAEQLLKRLSKEFPKGVTLIVCAGMNYASYVENVHNKNVLASANIKAETLAPKLLGELVRQVQNNRDNT